MEKRSSSQQGPKRIAKGKRMQGSITIGMDLGDKNSCYCVPDCDGMVVREVASPRQKRR
jgi:hypothetical protein